MKRQELFEADTPHVNLKRQDAKRDLTDYNAALQRAKVGEDLPEVPKDLTYGELALSSVGLGTTAVNVRLRDTVEGPPMLAGYFEERLTLRSCEGNYVVWARNDFENANGKWVSYKFNKQAMCPLCMKVCEYGFDYKVKAGYYAGWKCWGTAAWETDYDYKLYMDLFDKK